MQIEEFSQMLSEKLGGLETVKFIENPGAVRMFSGGKWHNLFRPALLYTVSGDIVIDYVNLTIGIINGEKFEIIFMKGDIEKCYTLYGNHFSPVNVDYYLGTIDEVTKKTITFQPGTFMVGKNFYDQELNLIATNKFIRLQPETITSIQHIHIVDELCVISSHYQVTIRGKYIAIDEELYSLYRSSDNDTFMLINDNNSIELTSLLKCHIICEKHERHENVENVENIFTFRGLVVPNYKQLLYIYELDGVWFGEPEYRVYIPLTPRKPNSGQKTKASLQGWLSN
jgi:hypothetical protein